MNSFEADRVIANTPEEDLCCLICQPQVGTCHGCLPFTSTRIKSCAIAAADLQHLLKEVQDGDQEWGTLCSGKNWQSRPSDSKIFPGEDFMSLILISPHI